MVPHLLVRLTRKSCRSRCAGEIRQSRAKALNRLYEPPTVKADCVVVVFFFLRSLSATHKVALLFSHRRAEGAREGR